MISHDGKRAVLLLAMLASIIISVTIWLCWQNLRFWWRFEPMGLNAQGCSEYRHRRTGIVMVRLPGGTFWMGAQKTDPREPNYDPDAQEHQGPVHLVELSPFLIGKYEVTQGQWVKVMGSNPSQEVGEHLPVERVSWDDCRQFCHRMALRLPSEAQWEYACQGGQMRSLPNPEAFGWFSAGGLTTHAVGEKAPNHYGLHDMLGNVWEYCEDLFDPDFYKKPEAKGRDPVSTSGEIPVCRGGSFLEEPSCGRCWVRGGYLPVPGSDTVGFRVVFYPLP